MSKYHINPETGNPNLCRAKVKCRFGLENEHYKTKEDAREAYELKSNESFVEELLLRKNADNVVRKFRKAGLKITTADLLKLEFYHESNDKRPPKPGTINSIKEEQVSYVIDKPSGVLWLSSGSEINGEVVTDWRLWTHDNDYRPVNNKNTSRAKFRPTATILELDEESVDKVNSVTGIKRSLHSEELQKLLFSDKKIINWVELKNMGVDAVRVNGNLNNKHFYGYDCDSLILLNGDAIIGWDEVPARVKVFDEELHRKYYLRSFDL